MPMNFRWNTVHCLDHDWCKQVQFITFSALLVLTIKLMLRAWVADVPCAPETPASRATQAIDLQTVVDNHNCYCRCVDRSIRCQNDDLQTSVTKCLFENLWSRRCKFFCNNEYKPWWGVPNQILSLIESSVVLISHPFRWLKSARWATSWIPIESNCSTAAIVRLQDDILTTWRYSSN
jgi:hypothetical protein